MKIIYTLIVSVIIVLSSLYINANAETISAYVVSEEMTKPIIVYENNNAIINETDITYLIYALDGEKLHKIAFTDDYPQIEILLSKSKTLFTSYIVDEEVQTYLGKAPEPDLQIRLADETLINILKSDDPKLALKEEIKAGSVGVTTYSDKTELFLKGYLELYDTLK